MKLLLPFIVLLASMCNAQNQKEKEIEDEIYACLVNSYKNCGVNLDDEIDSLHTYFVNTQILKDKSGQAIIEFLYKLQSSNKFSFERSIILPGLEKLPGVSFAICFMGNEITYKIREADSRITRIYENLKKIDLNSDSLFSYYAATLLAQLGPADFEKEPYKTILLTQLYYSSTPELTPSLNLVPLPKPERDTVKYEILAIKLLEGTEMTANGIKTDTGSLKIIVLDHLKTNQAKAMVVLRTERGTSYQRYIEVQNIVRQCYLELRNSKSMELFGKKFDELAPVQQEEIRRIIPQRISETESDN